MSVKNEKGTTPALKKAMISSTARDLPEHRKQVEEACHRMSLFAEHMMENLTAEDADAVEVSLRLVDEADVYIGIFAHRYGYVPEKDNPDGISITEMEYNRATERGIPRLVFFMHADHEVKFADVETGEGAEKLKKLKDRICKERVAAFFESPADLRAHCIQALSQLKDKYAAKHGQPPTEFHYVHPMTAPPEPYIAHPYLLLQTGKLIGRNPELNLLTDWITGSRAGTPPSGGWGAVRIFNVIAIGGMGKSALTWEWFHRHAHNEWADMAGRFWWSFYESDAYFENFVIRALAYVGRLPVEAVKKMTRHDREARLLQILDREPHLLVLDGIERILVAYARMDAAHLADDEYDQATANYVAQAYGLPESAAQSFTGEARLRQTADPRAGQFLRRLAGVRASRILVSSRLYPLALQNMVNRQPLPGCYAAFLPGLSDDDAVEIWRHFGVSGQRDELLRLFRTFEKHPLLLQALAGEIARYRPAPGDFDRWRVDRPDFDPFTLPLKQVKSHILLHAMHGLAEVQRKALHTIAAFRMPAQYGTLCALLMDGKPDEQQLDALLNELEDRGLIGWDRRANRYDLHPVVRGVVWSSVKPAEKQAAYLALQEVFEAAPKIENYLDVNSLEDLTPAIELYHALIGLERFDEACDLFYERINKATLYRLGTSRQRVELLEKLFPDGLEKPPCLAKTDDQAFTFNALALAYKSSGEPGKSCFFYEKQIEIRKKENVPKSIAIGLCNLSDALRFSGRLQEAATAAHRALEISQEEKSHFEEATSLFSLGLVTASIGQKESRAFLEKSKKIFIESNNRQLKGITNSFLAQHALWFSNPSTVKAFAEQAWELAHVQRHERDFILSARLQGAAALALSDHPTADERLHHALTRARAISLVEEELPTLAALAELALQREQPEKARELLEDVWSPAERGPYPLFHADACNVLCQIERDAGNQKAAIEAAEKAYRLAWCDGPPWAYHYGLENAKKHLRELGVEEPNMGERAGA